MLQNMSVSENSHLYSPRQTHPNDKFDNPKSLNL
jgi:hypothetical protein